MTHLKNKTNDELIEIIKKHMATIMLRPELHTVIVEVINRLEQGSRSIPKKPVSDKFMDELSKVETMGMFNTFQHYTRNMAKLREDKTHYNAGSIPINLVSSIQMTQEALQQHHDYFLKRREALAEKAANNQMTSESTAELELVEMYFGQVEPDVPEFI